jgi:hypothetical protein
MTRVYRTRSTLGATALLLLLQGDAWAETKVEGTAEALRIETSDSPIQEVLAALRDALKLEYRTSIQLDQTINGTYRGSLQRVLARVLDGYDFILKNSSEKVELVVLGRKGSGVGNSVANTNELASTKPANTTEKGQSGAANARTPQTAQQSTVPSMLTILAEQQLPYAVRSYPRNTPVASGPSNSTGSSGTVPSQAEIAALTQQAAGKLEALRSSLQRVGR